MTSPELALLHALPPTTREKVVALSAKLGQTPVEVLAAAVESFHRIQEFADCCVDLKGKPENPRLVNLVPDPEHRRIYRAVQRAMARDSAKRVSKEQIQARGRIGGLVRSANLTKQRLSEIGKDAQEKRWTRHFEKLNDIDNW